MCTKEKPSKHLNVNDFNTLFYTFIEHFLFRPWISDMYNRKNKTEKYFTIEFRIKEIENW